MSLEETWSRSVCPHDCASVCALDVETRSDGRLGRVRGNRAHRYTDGVICAKVARYAERFNHEARLTKPLRRTGAKGAGGWQEIGWDDALDEIADAFIRTEQTHGSEAVWPYFYAGTMGLVQRDGIDRLRHEKRYSGQGNTICSMVAAIGWNAGAGKRWGTDACEIEQSDLILLWGLNAVATQVQLMSLIARARKNRGAQLVVIDPYASPTALQADCHLALKPGTDAALACAVMHVLFRDGLADRDFLERYSDHPKDLERHLQTRGPAWAAEITGIDEAKIEDFARLYGRTKRSYLRLGFGFTRTRNGAIAMHAASCLPAVSGAWRYQGGGALYNQSDIYRLDKTLIQGLDVRDPSVRVLDMSRIGPVLANDPRDLAGGPPVHAMIVQNTNPACVAPELDKVLAGLKRDDLFVAVHEQFMTETAELADIVLPATMFLEHDDIYTAAGHTILQVGPKRFEPLPDCRSNHEVICALAERLGLSHPGFAMTTRELIDATLAASGYGDFATLGAEGGVDASPDFETAHFLKGFPTPDKKFRFKPDWSAFGPNADAMPAFPDQVEPGCPTDQDHPYRLVAGPARHFLNTSFTETPTSQAKEGRPTLQIRRDDAQELGIHDGALVRVGNGLGSVLLHAVVRDGAAPATLVIESIWPNRSFIEGVGINRLISAEPAWPAGGAIFHDTAVWLRPEA